MALTEGMLGRLAHTKIIGSDTLPSNTIIVSKDIFDKLQSELTTQDIKEPECICQGFYNNPKCPIHKE